MPLRLNEDSNRLFFESLQEPGPSLDLLGTAAFRVAIAALDLGFFQELARGPHTPAELAAACRVDAAAAAILLDNLEAYGYVAREGEKFSPSSGQTSKFRLTPMAERWMTPSGGDGGLDYSLVVRFWGLLLFHLWDDLEGTVRRGRPQLDLYRWLDERPAAQRVFQAMLGELARLNGREIVEALELDPARLGEPLHLLDLGAGHGRHALAFLEQVPGARATLVDSGSALAIAREHAEKAGLADRCVFRTGNFLEEELPSGVDLVYLLSIVHSFPPETNIELLKRIREALVPGGRLALLEQLSDDEDPVLPAVGRAYHLSFRLNLFHLMGGRTSDFAEVKSWLDAAGFTFERKLILPSTGDALLLAHRPRD